MMTNKQSVVRLSRYKNSLNRLKSLGFVKVFSDNIADAVGVTSSQVRKDFSLFGIAGNKRGGYNIDEILERLSSILGTSEVQNVILVGAGHLGSSLIKYKGFEKAGIKIAAAFDINPSLAAPAAAVPILPLDSLGDFVAEHQTRIGIIAVPDTAAQQVLELMTAAGIRGVLNFAPIRLRGSSDCVINYVNVESEMENLIYFVNVLKHEQPE